MRDSPAIERARRAFAGAWDTTGRAGLHEAVVVVTAFLVYFLIRGAVVDREDVALANARRLVDFEQALGFYRELAMQSWILDHYWAVRGLNAVYFWGHMPLVVIVAVWLWLKRRYEYVVTRNAFLASGAIGVAMYWLWPVAPPRLLPGAGFVDTMAVYDRVSYQAQETSAFVNPFAAMPSLHFGWALLLGAVVAWVGRRPAHYLFAAAWPLAMLLSIVMTGNHFIIDAVAGGIVSFAGLGIALALDRRWPQVFTRIDGRPGRPHPRGGGP